MDTNVAMTHAANPDDHSSKARSVIFRLRPDIQWTHYQDTQRWVALDPITNAFYYFNALEYQAALLLDGKHSLLEVFELLQRKSLHSKLSLPWIEKFAEKLFRTQLVEMPPGIPTNRLPTSSSNSSFFKSLLVNPLSIRIPLFRPSIDFYWAKLFARCVFSPLAISVLAVFLIAVSYLVASQLLSRPRELLYDVNKIQGDRWLALAALLVAIKSIHELGHYLACVHLKIRCAEIGALLLCFTPCLYCDTTESWRLSSRWQRAWIAAAGIYFEFWIALVGGLIFLNTQSGLIHVLAGGIWLMCTLGTLVLNANPLFRYDGYFILSDLMKAPNLGIQASRALRQSFVAALGGPKPDPMDYDLPLSWLVPFALLSMVYRYMVFGSIILFLWHFLIPAGLGLYFLAIIAAISFGILKTTTAQIHSLAAELVAPEPISPFRFIAMILTAVALVVGVCFVPLPNRTVHRGYIEYTQATAVYAPEDSTVESIRPQIVLPGDSVSKSGELLLQLDNADLRLERLSQEHQCQQLSSRIEVYKQAASSDETLAAEIPTLEQMLWEAVAKRKLIDDRLEKLRILSPGPGRFTPKTGWISTGFQQGQPKKDWQSVLTLADYRKRFNRGDLIGWFLQGSSQEVVALVSAETMRSINFATPVLVACDSNPGGSFCAKITHLSNDPIAFFPNELSGDPMFVLQRDERGLLQSETPLYRVRIQIHRSDPATGRGALCSVRFELPRLTLVQRFYKFFTSQFKPI
jgi:putative peptide zinc metalloprotease protein